MANGPTPGTWSIIVPDQSCDFGALTLASAGGVAPAGLFASVTIVSGDPLGHWQITNEGILTPTLSGANARLNQGPYQLVIACNGIRCNVIVNILADAYSAKSIAEAKAALSAIGAAGGKSILLRDGAYAEDATLLKNRSFSSPVILAPHFGATVVFSALDIRNSTNIIIDGFTFCRSVAGTELTIRDSSSMIVIQNSTFSGPSINPTGDYSLAEPLNINGITGDGTPAPTDVSILNNVFHDLYAPFSLGCAGALRFEGNYIHDFYEDGFKTSYRAGGTAITVKGNVWLGMIGNGADVGRIHPDFLQFAGAPTALADWSNITVERNIIVAKYARAGGQGIFMDDMPAGFYYADTIVRQNLLVNRGAVSVGIRIQQAKNTTVGNNTIVSTNLLPGTGPGILVGSGGSTQGVHLIENNVADSYSIGGSPDFANNITLGNAGAIIAYATAFDGPTFSPLSSVEATANFTPKEGGPLDIFPPVGAV